jgi:hypothetical protein
MNPAPRALLAAALLSLLCACAARRPVLEADVVAVGGKARAFEFDPATLQFTAWSQAGRLMFVAVEPGRLEIYGGRVTTLGKGCHGGFLTRSGKPGEEGTLIEVHLCPRDDAPAGWRGWHADFLIEQVADAALRSSLPTKADFAVSTDKGEVVQIASPGLRAQVLIPEGKATAPFRNWPEMVGLFVVTGIVPPSPQGQYEVVGR